MASTRPGRDFGEQTLRLAAAFLTSRGEGRSPDPEEAAAWGQFHGACDALVRDALLSRGLTQTDVDDCSQEVWLNLLSVDFAGLAPGAVRGRVAAIARNKAVDVFRRKSRRPASQLEGDGEVAIPDKDDGGDPAGLAEAVVWRALRDLDGRVPRRNLLTFYLRWIKGLPNTEIAELLGMKPEQVRLHQHRVKQVFLTLIDRGAADPVPDD